MPSQTQKGLDSHADADPVIAKTINIIMTCTFEVMPQRFFSLSMLYLKRLQI
jgi:hypothetical protein